MIEGLPTVIVVEVVFRVSAYATETVRREAASAMIASFSFLFINSTEPLSSIRGGRESDSFGGEGGG